eukprot:583886-Amphidinium_carterae.1
MRQFGPFLRVFCFVHVLLNLSFFKGHVNPSSVSSLRTIASHGALPALAHTSRSTLQGTSD